MIFNIFAQTRKELDSFFTEKLKLFDVQDSKGVATLSKTPSYHLYSQWETVNLIELYYNSKFQSGPYDKEGQRKVFLNIGRFRADVASKMVDLDTKDFVFIPDNASSIWPSYFFSKDFKQWSKDNFFGELINDTVERYPKYGTVVLKRLKDKLEPVPLRNLRNQQDCKTLKEADFVIEEHEYSKSQLSEFEEWETKDVVEYGEKVKVFERYGEVPKEVVNGWKQGVFESEDDDMVKAMSIVVVDMETPLTQGEKKKSNEKILYCAEIDEYPYEEVHWAKQDGRWLGIGEIENLFENQFSVNELANIRRRALMWASRKVYQSSDDGIARNLLRDVKDGDILRITPNGNVTQVDTATRALAEFSSDEQVWEQNSQQKSFTYEVATGEALPSGTPFRLGVQLAAAVRSHFDLKREKLGLFFKRVVMEFMIPIFQKEMDKEKILTFQLDEDGVNDMKQAIAEVAAFNAAQEALTFDNPPDYPSIKARALQEMEQRPFLFVQAFKEMYKNMESHLELVITGEEVDIASKIETWKNIFQIISANPMALADPNSRNVLKKIAGLAGENIDSVLSSAPPMMQPMGQPAGQAGQSAGFQVPTAQPSNSMSL